MKTQNIVGRNKLPLDSQVDGRTDTNGRDPSDNSKSELLRAKATAAMSGLGLRTMYAAISNGEFPKPIQLSKRRVAWLRIDIQQWLAAKIAERDRISS